MSKLSSEEENAASGRRLAAIRSANQMTQHEFAESLGLSARAYANYERGEREMPTSLFKSLVEVFGIDPLWLLTGSDTDLMYIAKSHPLDADLLESIVCLIEGWLTKHRRVLKPEKKARVIRLAYEHCIEQGQVNAGHLNEMLFLAA